MKILPLVFALLLILSILTIEKMENFKNRIMVQQSYEKAMNNQELSVFNKRQLNLYGNSLPIHRHITFRPFLKKDEREANSDKYKQFRQITIDLIKVAYGKAAFFKKMEQRRPEFVEELLDAIQESTDKMPDKSIRRIKDIPRIKLADPELQEAYYRMLKGTIERDTLKKAMENPSCRLKNMPDKTYHPLLTYFNFDKMDKQIKLGLACRELLLAIYDSPGLVDKLIAMRRELTKQVSSDKLHPDEAKEKFKTEFEGKQKQGIIDVLDYSISKTSKAGYD